MKTLLIVLVCLLCNYNIFGFVIRRNFSSAKGRGIVHIQREEGKIFYCCPGASLKIQVCVYKCSITRKYSLRGYILGVLMHTTAWDHL